MATESAVKVEISAQDDRKYKHVTLANALQVLLISDPETDKAAAAMDVKVGSLSDPDAIEGLAHFLEHMLFLGTAKYPDENSYNAYLSAHGGHSNACVAARRRPPPPATARHRPPAAAAVRSLAGARALRAHGRAWRLARTPAVGRRGRRVFSATLEP